MHKGKWILVATFIALALFLSSIAPVAAETTGGMNVSVNNSTVFSASSTVYLNRILMAPAKELAEALGGTFQYDSSHMSGIIRVGDRELSFRLDSNVAKLNGKNVLSTAPMKIINYRFMIPVEFSAVKLGAEAYVNSSRNTLMLYTPQDGKLVYKVVPGDTLWLLSKIFGTTVAGIKQANNLNSDMIYVDQKLVIKNMLPADFQVYGTIIKNATLWYEPSFNAKVLNYLFASTDITITGKQGDWYKVNSPKGSGYVYYTVVSVKQDMEDNTPDSTFFSNNIAVDTSSDYITYTSYTVKKGDTIWSISQKVGIPDYELAQVNGISPYAYLSIGQVLKIPVHNIAVKTVASPGYGEILDWFSEGQYVFPIGKTGKFIDLITGKSFMAKRTMGANHSDTEVLTAQDAQIMKEIFGGNWTWDRRPFILEVDGRRFAVSVAGMPHAGVDGVPYLQNVADRSDNWGYGPNYDSIPYNGMDGHFDVYFLNSVRHVDNKIDPAHQYKVLVAGGLK